MESKRFKNWKKHLVRFCKVNNIKIEEANSLRDAMNSFYGSVNKNIYFSNNIYVCITINNVKIFYTIYENYITITHLVDGHYHSKYYHLRDFKTFYELLNKIFSKTY